MNQSELKSLVANHIKGDKKAFTLIYKETVNKVFAFVYSRVGNKQWAEDIVSETYITLLDILQRFDESSKVETFIIGIANNKIKQYLSKLKELDNFNEEEEGFIEDISEDEENSLLAKQNLDHILNLLSEEYRGVLECRFIKLQSIKDTAIDLAISEGNVRVIQHRALQKATELAKALFQTNLETHNFSFQEIKEY